MHFRKFSPIDREYPIFELVDANAVLLDISKNDDGIVEIAFHEALRGRVLDLEHLERLLAEGRALMERETRT